MPRYFLEVSYKGTNYAGFQAQPNAVTIQSEIEMAFNTFFGSKPIDSSDAGKTGGPLFGARRLFGWLTGSSRTDAGVHALQNFFHFDWHEDFQQNWIYNLNAILPSDIVLKSVVKVAQGAHARFDAVSRLYNYRIYDSKNPFLKETAYFYPYPLDYDKLNEAAAVLKTYTDFTSFSKRNTQVKTFNCNLIESCWYQKDGILMYEVRANRFLRGMVRALTATMLKVGRRKISIEAFKDIIEAKDCTQSYFDTPAHGLFLVEVAYAD